MTIKQQGGIFGRNPTFNNVTVDGNLVTDQIFEKTAAAGISLNGVTLKDGNVVLANGKGIDFSATSGTGISELFNDYEEGTWTPTVSSGTIGTVRYASYIKCGNMIHATFRLEVLSDSTTDAPITVTLPFAAGSFSASRWLGSWLVRRYNVSDSRSGVLLIDSVTPTTAKFSYSDNTVGSEPRDIKYLDRTTSTGSALSGSITYFT
jgi:hypothetical protein